MFSILIPTWNNLALLQLCVRSIRENSAYHHQNIHPKPPKQPRRYDHRTVSRS